MGKGDQDQGARALKAMGRVLLGGLMALAVGLLFLFVCALLISKGAMGWDHAGYMSVAACLLGSFAGGFFAVRRCGGRGIIVGTLTGMVLFLVLLTLGLVLYRSPAVEEGALPLGLGCLCGGAMAGLLGNRPKKKRRK